MNRALKQEHILRLRTQIAAIERRPALTDTAPAAQRPRGLFVTPAGFVQELYADETRNGAALLGFALGLARPLLTRQRPALVFFQLGHESQESGLPYGPGLRALGFEPENLVLVRTTTLVELLWALEEAICCKAVAVAIADVGGSPKLLDFTISRRLSLRAQASGATVLQLRYGLLREASAAQLRWHLAPAPSAPMPFDPRAPGPPRYLASLEKGRLAGFGTRFLLDWTDHGFQHIEPDRAGTDGRAALSQPLPADLGHRLSQAG